MGGFYSFFALKNFSLEIILLQAHSETKNRTDRFKHLSGDKIACNGPLPEV